MDKSLASSYAVVQRHPFLPGPLVLVMGAGGPAAPDDGRGADSAELLERIAGGRDSQAFAALFDRYAPRLKAFLVGKGCQGEQAEEIAQEAMLAVWRRAGTYDPGRARASTWIFTIARNRYIDRLRRKKVSPDELDDPSLLPAHPEAADTTLARQQTEARVRTAIAELSDEQRAVVEMSFFAGKSHGEIAAVLALPLGTVKSRIRLAFGRLREALESER